MKDNHLLNWQNVDGRIKLEGDWYALGLPENVDMHETSYVASSYGFSMFNADTIDAFKIGRASGCYDNATLITTAAASISIGEFSIIQGSFFYCHKSITVGDHCMISWSAVLLDGWIDENVSVDGRRQLLLAASQDKQRKLSITNKPEPIMIGNNVWIGFGSVIMPGITIGRGSIIGCKSYIVQDVPEYAIVTGNPAKVIRYLNADDTESRREEILREFIA